MRTPANDPSEGYDLLVNAAFGKDWITLKAGSFHIDALCSISSATIEFEFVRCVAIAIDDEDEQDASRITVREQHSEKRKTTLGGGIDGSASLAGPHGKAHANVKWEKTTNVRTTTQRQMVPDRRFYRNSSKSVQIGRLGEELSGPVMTKKH
jgi:hypothetical protein